MNRTIPLVKPKIHDFDLFTQRARQVFDSGQLTNNGPFLQQWEREITGYLGVPSLAVVNATIGMELVLRYYLEGQQDGQQYLTGTRPSHPLRRKIIVPSFTYAATAHAIVLTGFEPVFVDIRPDTFTLDPEKVRAAITPETRALVAVHVFGNPCAIDQLTAIAEEHHLPLLFDAAHAYGSLYKGRRIGQFGTAEVFSTHACKTLISAEGGIISTFNQELLAYLQRARNFGFVNVEETDIIGTNAKMSELHALVGLDSFAHIRQTVAQQQEIASWYFRFLQKIPGLQFQRIEAGAESNFFNLAILIDQEAFGMNRDALAETLTAAGIQSRKYFYRPLHQHRSYAQYASTPLPQTEAVASQVLCLPMHTSLNKEDVHYIAEVIQTACRQSQSRAFPGISPHSSPPTQSSFIHSSLRASPLASPPPTLPAKMSSLPLALTINNGLHSPTFVNSQGIGRVLVTGGAGYVGCVLVKKLLEKGYQVRILDQLVFGKDPLAEFISHPRLDLCVGLVQDRYMVQKCLEDMDAVIHLAGLSNDPTCEINPELTRKSNIEATTILLELAKAKKIKRFIYASTCSVYGFTGGIVVDEESSLNPITAYAQSKADCEKILLAAATEDLTVSCLRKATIYGASPRMRFDLVINTMTGMGLSEGKIIINGGEQWRPFVHVDDVADCYSFMLEVEGKKINKQIFNVGSNEQNICIADLASQIQRILPQITVEQSTSTDTRSYRVCFDKITTLGWRSRRSIENGVQGIRKLFDNHQVKDFRDINYFNIKRLITHLNI